MPTRVKKFPDSINGKALPLMYPICPPLVTMKTLVLDSTPTVPMHIPPATTFHIGPKKRVEDLPY